MSARCSASCRRSNRASAMSGAGLFAPDLRRRARTQYVIIDRPDILIFEGSTCCCPAELPQDGKDVPFVSDFFDFSVYLDAAEEALAALVYLALHAAARNRVPRSALLLPQICRICPTRMRRRPRSASGRASNLRNLHENILPTRPRASLILTKGITHRIEEVALRKL